MNKETKAFNIYCDESRVENRDSRYMVIGAMMIPRARRDEFYSELTSIFRKHQYGYELKWIKVHERFKSFYEELFLWFLEKQEICFRSIVVDKDKVDYEGFHENDEEIAFYKFYYYILRSFFNSQSQYYIMLDRKPSRDKNHARALHSYLNSYILTHRGHSKIRHLQAYDSKENLFIQLADFLTGAVSFSFNREGYVGYKTEFRKFVESKINRSILTPCLLSENKFNIFVWEPHK